MESMLSNLTKVLAPPTQSQPAKAPLGGVHTPLDPSMLSPPSDNLTSAAHHASTTSSDPMTFFAPIITQLLSSQLHANSQPLDEASAIAHHKSYFDDSTPSKATNTGIGTAAAMQALKLFINNDREQSQSRLMGLAMAQAAKLFDDAVRQGKVGDAEKEGSVLRAGEMVLRMYQAAHQAQQK